MEILSSDVRAQKCEGMLIGISRTWVEKNQINVTNVSIIDWHSIFWWNTWKLIIKCLSPKMWGNVNWNRLYLGIIAAPIKDLGTTRLFCHLKWSVILSFDPKILVWEICWCFSQLIMANPDDYNAITQKKSNHLKYRSGCESFYSSRMISALVLQKLPWHLGFDEKVGGQAG